MPTTPFKADDAELIEFIVQEVIRRLKSGGAMIEGSVAPANGARDLALTDRLITLATVKGRLDGVRRLVVTRKALVTPAVRDELRAREIELFKD